jgi:glycosyltransferase involved in cell wall biosynthesis
LKILIVNTKDLLGGAARASYRLHNALLAEKVDSQLLVQVKQSDSQKVISQSSTRDKILDKLRPLLDTLPLKFYKNRTASDFSTSWFGNNSLIRKINEINPDIVHLHWVNNGMIQMEQLKKIKAPIVWSLHDMWAFTGGCHYNGTCESYKVNCGMCPVLGSKKENDLSRKIWNRKLKIFKELPNLTIIGLSKWMKEAAKQSSLMENLNVINLPNPIDTTVFKPFDKKLSREIWNLPKNKKLILFGAMAATSDSRKGFSELVKAVNTLKITNLELVVFGSSEPKTGPKFNFKTHYVGTLNDDVSLTSLYNAVDVMIVPSLQENLSNAIMESLSCGTPVVGFNIGGNMDMIEHKKTGYLAKPYDVFELSFGIEWVLNFPEQNKLLKNSREKVLKEFDSHVVAQKYLELYAKILS